MRIADLVTHRTPIQSNVWILELRTDAGLVGLSESFWGAEAVESYLHSTAALLLAGLRDVRSASAGIARGRSRSPARCWTRGSRP